MSLRSRRRTPAAAFLAALALICALALARPEAGVAAEVPAAMAVTASLDSCSKSEAGATCQFSVSFGATISSPGGAELLTAPAQPSGSTFTVPYVGDGTYGVRVVAYGPG